MVMQIRGDSSEEGKEEKGGEAGAVRTMLKRRTGARSFLKNPPVQVLVKKKKGKGESNQHREFGESHGLFKKPSLLLNEPNRKRTKKKSEGGPTPEGDTGPESGPVGQQR